MELLAPYPEAADLETEELLSSDLSFLEARQTSPRSLPYNLGHCWFSALP